MFIRRESEQPIKDFFMRDIDALLDKYEPGLPKMKPDVLIQMERIKRERDEMIKQETEKMQNGPIMLQQGDGQPPIQLNTVQIVSIIQQLQEANAKLTQQNTQLQHAYNHLQHVARTMETALNEMKKSKGEQLLVPNKI
jgi:DNA repair ATPase RecN